MVGRTLVSKKCLTCDNLIYTNPARLKIRKYCSPKCRRVESPKTDKNHNVFKSGIGIYRRWALNYYGEKCIKCESIEKIQVHHIDEDRENNDLSNLMVLCVSCHKKEHRTVKRGNCLKCGNVVKRVHGKYCSYFCRSQKNYEKIIDKERPCEYCKQKMPFTAKLKQRFCCRECSGKFIRKVPL